MLALRPNCELCDVDLPPHAPAARICSYECTFCVDCVQETLHNVCPNCGGGFVPRPMRPQHAWRDGTGLINDPPEPRRRKLRYSMEQVSELVRTLQDAAPEQR